MSRIGKLPISIPAGVTVALNNGVVSVKGPKGELSQKVDSSIIVKIEDGHVVLSVDGKEYKKTATVTINIIPKPEVGADEEEITQPSEQNIEEQTTQPAQSQENSEKASVQTGDSKIIFWYAALMIVLGTVIATSLIVSRKRKIR